MYCVYILKSRKDNQLYIGYSSKLEKRIKEHNSGQVPFTKLRVPLDLIYFEAYNKQCLATSREKHLKQFGSAYGHLKKRLAL